MDILLHIVIFIIGCFVGSLVEEIGYRISTKKKILSGKLKCHKCNHDFEWSECIPIISHLIYNGKCKHCNKPLVFKKFVVEMLFGIITLLLAKAYGITTTTATVINFCELFVSELYLVFLYFILVQDFNSYVISTRIMNYGIVISVIRIATDYITCYMMHQQLNLNRLIIYLVAVSLLLVASLTQKKKNKKKDYPINVALICVIMGLFTQELAVIISVIMTLFMVFFRIAIKKVNDKSAKYQSKKVSNLPIGAYLAVSNFTILLISVFMLLD